MIRKFVQSLTVLCALSLFAGMAYAQAASPSPAPAKKSSSKTSATPKSQQVDINSATKEQLTAISGIGDVTAQKIIDGRPYKTKKDLVTKGILTQAQYDKMKDQLVAHGGKPKPAASPSPKK
ncbi:MAG TPA: helix-hairpin-helix domain-containing protein [Candidatus Angelobacter sp.]